MKKEMNTEETMGQRIRECRKKMGYSQEELAEMLFIKKSTISKYEKDERDMPASILKDIANILKVNPNYLLNGYVGGDEWIDEMMVMLKRIDKADLREVLRLQIKAVSDAML